ncbi:MAG: hypothetical protein IPM29_03230 [Planctomycetes bacterium]|nr:hypothetical protein [Planctomycetota bacterium]
MHAIRILALGSLAATTTAQCQNLLQSVHPFAEVRGILHAMTTWDPDGPGPLPVHLVVAGSDLSAGSVLDSCLLVHDGTAWSDLRFGRVGSIQALAVFGGELHVGGAFSFTAGGGDRLDGVARWDGTRWRRLGNGVIGTVNALAVHNGELIAGGFFQAAGATAASNIARWSGTTWSQPGSGVTGIVRALASFGGVLWVGGNLSAAGGAPASNLARWNGTAWLATPGADAEVRAFAVRGTTSATTSFLFAGGDFATIGGVAAAKVARLQQSTGAWSALGAGLPAVCTTLSVRPTGQSTFELVAGIDDPGNNRRVWSWNGNAWSNLGALVEGSLPQVPRALVVWNGSHVVGVQQSRNGVRRFVGGTWSPVRGLGIDDTVLAVAADGADLVVGGTFRAISGTAMNGIARRTGAAWAPIGAGFDDGEVRAVARLAAGRLVAAGSFTSSQGVPMRGVAEWDGAAWRALGGGTNGDAFTVLVLPDGDVVVGGEFTAAGGIPTLRIARWNGTSWSGFGGGLGGAALVLARLPDDTIVAGGEFTTAGGVPCVRAARWDGTGWQPLGSGLDARVRALAVLPNGDLVAGGEFGTAGGVPCRRLARWNGVAWSPLGAGADDTVYGLLALPGGDVLAGGAFVQQGTTASNRLGRWDGGGWTGFGSGLQDRAVRTLAMLADGQVAVGGEFYSADGIAAGRLATLSTDCPPVVATYGAGCSGSGGTLALGSSSLPWLGTVFRAQLTNSGPVALPLAIWGLQPTAVPIAAILPQGLPGCDLLATLELTDTPLAASGVVTSVLPLPAVSALVGARLFHQIATLEFDLGGNLVGIASSNGLALTLGAF